MLPVLTRPRGSRNANFASFVVALKLRNVSAKDSLFAWLRPPTAEEFMALDWVPFTEGVVVITGVLKRPVQSFGAPFAVGEFGLVSFSSARIPSVSSLCAGTTVLSITG
jgi:hypothetical protein